MADRKLAEKLSQTALGSTVTPDILTGSKRFYPDITAVLEPEEQPHHIALLTVHRDLKGKVGDYETEYKTDDVALVASENLVRIVSSNGVHVAESYSIVSGVDWDQSGNRWFRLHLANGAQTWSHQEASSAEDRDFTETVEFISGMADYPSFEEKERSDGRKTLEERHRDGDISDAEYLKKKNG
jgi:hypothetical protein